LPNANVTLTLHFVYIIVAVSFGSMSDEKILLEKLREEGVDIEKITPVEKILYVWKLYLASEVCILTVFSC